MAERDVIIAFTGPLAFSDQDCFKVWVELNTEERASRLLYKSPMDTRRQFSFMGTFYHFVIGLVLATVVLAAPQDSSTFLSEGRGKLKKALLPFLIGIVLKAYTLVPIKLMVMTFVAMMALLLSKIGVAIAGVLALHQYYQQSSYPLSQELGAISPFSPPFYAVTTPGQAAVANQAAPTGHDQQYSPPAPQPYIRRIYVKYT